MSPLQLNRTASIMAADAAIRGLAASVLALGVGGLTVHTILQSQTEWGATLSVPVVIVTGLVLGGIAALAALVQIAAAALLHLRRDRAFVFTKWGVLGPSGTIPGELVVSGGMTLFALLAAGGLLDASSGRTSFVLLPVLVFLYGAALFMLMWRRVAILTPGEGVRVCPFTLPLVSIQSVEMARIAKVHLGLGELVTAMTHDGREIVLGELRFGADVHRIEHVRAVAAACGVGVSGVERVKPAPAPVHRGRGPGDPLPLP